VLFSNDEIAAFMNGEYECAWECVRAAPRVEIDFGDGRKLTRTLQGNVATLLCTPGGRVADIIPGLWDREAYAWRLSTGLDLIRSGRDIVSRHQELLESGADAPLRMADVRKYRVESPVKDALQDDTDHNVAVRMPQVHKLLIAQPLPKPADIRSTLFRDILGYDIDDPYLGLAPVVLGGEGGRK
jgi:hypothetical protein